MGSSGTESCEGCLLNIDSIQALTSTTSTQIESIFFLFQLDHQTFTKIVRQNASSPFPPHQCCTRVVAG